ncbi:enoyl-CoA hydratase-related protein [Stappia albiluteola]|nr:enoyl-CoA hydratase-related protein [Stappia albiluteola]
MADCLIEERPEEGVLLLRLNRPQARNALNTELRVALSETLRSAANDGSTRVAVVTGDATAFAAGADITVVADETPMGMHRLAFHKLWQDVADFPKPLIAAVNGYALGGGCELALHADIIVAGKGASFGLPEVKLGIMPGAGGTQRLVRAVGKYRAFRLLMTGDIIDAEKAADWGLVSELAEDGEVLATALKMAGKIARLPPFALEHIKETVLLGADLPLQSAIALERKSYHMLFDTADQKEGMKAFKEKRKPDFKGE